MSRSFLVVLGDPVDFLVCSGSRGSRSRRLDIHPERGNSLRRLNAHRRERGLVHSRRVTLCTTAILVCRVNNRCKQAQFFVAFLLAPFVADLTALLFKNLDEFCHWLNT